MSGFVSFEHLSPQFQVYLLILHTIVIGWIVHILINVFHKNSETHSQHVANVKKDCPSIRVVHVDDKRVTVESCHWLNSILNWFHINASNTPDLVKIWLTMLNEKLKADKDSIQFTINSIVSGSLPPTLTNVYCSNAQSNIQCIAMHIETTKLGFIISLLKNDNPSGKPTNVEVEVTKLSGELIFQVLARQTRYDLTVKFIGDPELKLSSCDILQDSDRSAVEEKLKEVICKTVVNIPLTEGKPGEEIITSNLVPESGSSCVNTDGKLLVKITKASGLTGIDKTDIPDVYCVLSSKEPLQKKKTKTIKETKDPVWNELHVIDVNEKTKEIAFDLYNELKSSEETGFLGQVIVPLAMIGKDQSCRLILPLLPTSTQNSYVTGQINLEFTYDNDGKAFTGLTEEASSMSNVSTEEKPKTDQRKSKVVEEVRPSSPQRLVFTMATLDIVDDDDDHLEFVPVVDHGIGRQDIVEAEQKIAERSTHGGYETDPILMEENLRHHEMLQELIELDKRSASEECSQTKETQEIQEKAESIQSTQRPASLQTSRPMSPAQEPASMSSCEQPKEIQNNAKKTEPMADNIEDAPIDQSTEKKLVTLDENLMEDLTPDTRRKVFREAFSMRINRNSETDGEKAETVTQKTTGSKIEKRNSFSDGEKVQQKALAKSGSDVSLSSLYDSTKSVLVVETRDRGQVKYYQIPPLMAKRGTFDHKGTKLHICNDHLFVATHFNGTLPSCNVCNQPLTGYFGKQGYECRDCHMISHKRCHYETNTACTKSTLSSLKIKKAATIYGYK